MAGQYEPLMLAEKLFQRCPIDGLLRIVHS